MYSVMPIVKLFKKTISMKKIWKSIQDIFLNPNFERVNAYYLKNFNIGRLGSVIYVSN